MVVGRRRTGVSAERWVGSRFITKARMAEERSDRRTSLGNGSTPPAVPRFARDDGGRNVVTSVAGRKCHPDAAPGARRRPVQPEPVSAELPQRLGELRELDRLHGCSCWRRPGSTGPARGTPCRGEHDDRHRRGAGAGAQASAAPRCRRAAGSLSSSRTSGGRRRAQAVPEGVPAEQVVERLLAVARHADPLRGGHARRAGGAAAPPRAGRPRPGGRRGRPAASGRRRARA